MKSAFQLNRLFFTDVRITAQQEAGPRGELDTQFRFTGAASDPEQLHWTIVLRVTLEPKVATKPSYSGTVEAVGTFTISEMVPAGERARFAYISGCGIVYSSIRELVANITSRGPWPTVLLTTVTFASLVDDALKNQGKAPPKKVEPRAKVER